MLVRRCDTVLLGDATSRLEDRAGVQSSSENVCTDTKIFFGHRKPHFGALGFG